MGFNSGFKGLIDFAFQTPFLPHGEESDLLFQTSSIYSIYANNKYLLWKP